MNENEIKALLSQLDSIPLPDREQVLRRVGKENVHSGRRWFGNLPRRRSLIAACLCVFMLLSVFTVNVAAAENAQYQAAVEFFDENGLSTDGYSRGEIKKICKDITSLTFTYQLTPHVIRESLGIVEVNDGTPLRAEEVKALWEKQQRTRELTTTQMQSGFLSEGEIVPTGVSFVYRVQVRYVDRMEDAYSILEKYQDGTLVWSKTLEGLSLMQVQHNETHVVLVGVSAEAESNRLLLLMTHEGDILWKQPILDASNVLLQEDCITVVGNGGTGNDSAVDKSKLYIASFDMQGKAISLVHEAFYHLNFEYVRYLDASYHQPSYTVEKAVRVGEHYYLVLSCCIYSGQQIGKRQMSVARVSSDGYLEAMYEIAEPMASHRITDIAVKGNTLYIGGYRLPSANDPLGNGLLLDQTEELHAVKQELLAANGSIGDRELLDMLREQYTGFVICCDIQSGEITQIKTAAGAKNATFEQHTSGAPVWKYADIVDAHYEIIDCSGAPWSALPDAEVDIVFHTVEHVLE